MKHMTFLRAAMICSMLLFFIFPDIASYNSTDNAVKVGFSSIDLGSCIRSERGYRLPLEARCLAIEGNGQNTLIYTLDFMEVSCEFCRDIQVQISKELSICPESILIHTTHTHSAPADYNIGVPEIDRHELGVLLIKAANEAIAKAKPAKVKMGEENIGKSLSVNRRYDTGTGLGVQTYWFGYEYTESDDRPEASALINEMSSRWMGKFGNYKSGTDKVYFDGEVDPLVQTMYFVDLHDKPLGSIIRFSAHPHLASFFKNLLFDPDFPGRTRKLMEKELGGPCLFLQGGSGDLVPKEKVKYQLSDNYKFNNVYLGPISRFYAVDEEKLLFEMNRIGEDIARAAIKALKRERFTMLTNANYTFKPLNIPINPSLPKTTNEIDAIRKALTNEYNAYLNTNGTLNEIRRLANVMNWLDWGAYYALGYISETDRNNGYKPMPFSVLQINSTPIVFMNSELMVETTLALRENFKALNPWIISLTGGTLQYIPTDKMIDNGGYEGRNTVIEKGTEPKVREHIAGMLGQ
jgi:neutral ceramidase